MANTLAYQPLVESPEQAPLRRTPDLQIITTPVVEPREVLEPAPVKLFTHPFRLMATIAVFYAVVGLAIWQGIALLA